MWNMQIFQWSLPTKDSNRAGNAQLHWWAEILWFFRPLSPVWLMQTSGLPFGITVLAPLKQWLGNYSSQLLSSFTHGKIALRSPFLHLTMELEIKLPTKCQLRPPFPMCQANIPKIIAKKVLCTDNYYIELVDMFAFF